ncbi:glutamate--tRNA ligase [Candidatus Saccharibacteria bacterium]|nr:glutamate--tRNA ligase [Candidatus Saccharibacteria bacterium]
MTIRTRFAPSPTGYLHVGGIRTALFAFLVARQAGGQFILRLEDTDKKREVDGSADHLITSLHALGLTYDEGPDIGGPYAPYIQSERLQNGGNYHQWANKLLQTGRAYVDPYTPEEVQGFREQAQKEKRAFLYRDHRPDNPSIQWDLGMTLRFKSEPKAYTWHDEVMGDISTGPDVVDDFILVKADGYPTYNFAHIIDDAEMRITHVIRGQEFISSMPNYLNLYEALGILPEAESPSPESYDDKEAAFWSLKPGFYYRPLFAHMPHIMNEQGNKKLGKRDGAKDVLDYIRDGYLPEALDSFIATMGWNDGTEQEVFTMNELIEKFSFDRVQRSGARFDEKRLLWMNGQWIRRLELDDLYQRVAHYWPNSAETSGESYKKQVLTLVQDRLKTLAELPLMTRYFFEEPKEDWSLVSDNKQLSKLERGEITTILHVAHDALQTVDNWTPDAIQATLNVLLETTHQKPAILFGLIRVVTTWAPFSPQLGDTLALLGKERTLARLSSVPASAVTTTVDQILS